jgi:hypothetical protein
MASEEAPLPTPCAARASNACPDSHHWGSTTSDAVEDALLTRRSVRGFLPREGAPRPSAPDYPYYPARWRDPYLAQRRKVSWALYGLPGIAKSDQAAARRQHARNYRFFGAPVCERRLTRFQIALTSLPNKQAARSSRT